MKLRRRTAIETAASFRASYERRIDKGNKAVADPVPKRRLGAIVKACRAAGRPLPVWLRASLFRRRR